ncbi:MAG: amidohydrolase family protein [Dehalococcoidia bacterium]
MIIDFHTHILPPSFRESRLELAARDATCHALFSGEVVKVATADQLVSAMDEDGVDVAVALGYGWCDLGFAQLANAYTLESAAKFGERIVPFCTVDPAWGDAALLEIEHCAAAGARGIGELHPASQGIDLATDERLAEVMALAERLGLMVLVHSSEPVGHAYAGKGDTHPRKLLAFAERFPRNVIVCAHWGGGLPFYELMPEVQAALVNVYFDTATSPFLYRQNVFPAVAAAAGSGKVLFGSDYPLIRPGRVIAEAKTGLTPHETQDVLGRNAARLLRLEAGTP